MSPSSPTTKIALTGQLPAAVTTSSRGAPSGSTTTALSSSSSWNTSGAVSTQSPEPMQSARSTVISMRFAGESFGTSAAAAEQRQHRDRNHEEERDERSRLGQPTALVVGLHSGRHRELLGCEHVMRLLDSAGVGGQPVVAGADPELVGGEDVVWRLDAARIVGHGEAPGFVLAHPPYRSRSWTRALTSSSRRRRTGVWSSICAHEPM